MTILKREPRAERKVVFDLFWSFRKWFSGSKVGKTETIQYIKNILFFVPYGILFPWKEKGLSRLLISVFVFSSFVEVIQYIFALGWCELDDVISNTAGAVIGFEFFVVATGHLRKEHRWREF